MDAAATARAYYAALDDERFDDLHDLLAPGFTQVRPDRTFDDRDAFLAFVAEDRPHADTTHRLDGVFVRPPNTTRTYEHHTEGGVAVHRVTTDETDSDGSDDGGDDSDQGDDSDDGGDDSDQGDDSDDGGDGGDDTTDTDLTTDTDTSTPEDETTTVVVRGTVERDPDDVLVAFVDVFQILAGRIVALDTYTQ